MARLRTSPKRVGPSLLESALRCGLYLTDGERLFRVLDAAHGYVLLEDCGHTDAAAVSVTVEQVIDGMRLVRPAGKT